MLRVFVVFTFFWGLSCVSGCVGASRQAVPSHKEARAQLGLLPGAVWTYSFEARITERVDGMVREVKSQGGYEERVESVSSHGKFTIVKVQRKTFTPEGEDREGWSIQRKSGSIYYVIGPEGRVHNALPPDTTDYDVTLPGRNVYVQRGKLRTRDAEETYLAYVLPLRTGVMWHAAPAARAMAGSQRVTNGIRTVPRTRDVATPGGDFKGCYQVETPGATVTTTVWVCPGMGMVRRLTERRTGNPRFVINEELTAFKPGYE